MRRLIVSRPVRLALAVALVAGVAAGLVVAARRRRAAVPVPPGPRPAPWRDAAAPARSGPEPVLGWPTADDLARYARPEGGAPIARLLSGLPRIGRPRGTKARRWTAALVALGLLALGAQALDSAVFGPERGSSGWTAYAGEDVEPCLEEGCPAAGNHMPPGYRPCPASGCGVAGEPVPSADPVADVPVAEPPPSLDAACALRRTGGTTPVVRPISRRVTAAVNRQWRRMEKWLKAHAPKTYASLNKPAGPRLVAKAEARLGRPIPDSLRASLLRHDGARGPAAFRLPSNHALMGARGLVASWPEACAMGGGIPLAYDPDSGGYLVTSSATGGVGFADWELPYFEDEWSSYYALLKSTADALAGSRAVDGSVPVVREGVLGWD
ncbi:hypothetical protein ACWEQG_03420 [Microbispora sp. NPDC004025]